MQCFRLHRKDGTFEVICSRCRVLVGRAADNRGAREIEGRHRCQVMTPPERSFRGAFRRRRALGRRLPVAHSMDDAEVSGAHPGTNIPFAFLSVAVSMYAAPTALEFFATHYFNPWLATIVLGDLMGCVWLATIFKMRKTGLLLYLLLGVCKACLCLSQAIPATTVFWITDLIPAAVVAGRIAWGNAAIAQADLHG